jgi:hypothetical protein
MRLKASNILKYYVLLIIGALCTQCSDDEYYSSASSSSLIRFQPTLQPWQQNGATRGTIVTGEEFKDRYESYRVFAWTKDSKGSTTRYIMGETVKSATGKTDADYYWPGAAYNLYFLAFAPSSFAASPTLVADTLTIPYTVPTDVTQQQDILYAATATQTDEDGKQTLEFQHALTAVQIVFKNKDQMATIESVSLDSVYSTATLKYVVKDESISWINPQAVGDFTVAKRQKEGEDGDDPDIATNEYTFLMLPQEFSDEGLNKGASLVLHFSDGKVYCKALSEIGRNWEAGHKVIYTIDYTGEERIFEAPDAVDIEYDATSLTINDIVSKRETDTLAWDVVYKPTWLIDPSKGKGSITFGVGPSMAVSTGNKAIRERGTAEGTIDLSDEKNTGEPQNTANCYIINRAGTYKFPLVYGNGLKDGKPNTAAYTNTGSNKSYVNHLGNLITSPYIYDNDGCKPDHVELLWQDYKNDNQGLIKKLDISDDKHYVIFSTADQEHIGQGNALIAVYDAGGTILWSWHIWVTFYIPNQDPDIVNDWKDKVIIPYDKSGQEKYIIMPINLGWCDNATYYEGQEDSVVLKQTATRETRTIKVIRRPKIENPFGSQTFYQWCRKDPFIPADMETVSDYSTITKNTLFNDKEAFNIKGETLESSYNFVSTNIDLKTTIQQPNTFAGGSDYSISKDEDILWRNDVKTIYDPSPIGYKICDWPALSVVTNDLGKTIKLENNSINTPYTKTEKKNGTRYIEVDDVNGWVFYCYPMKDGKKDPSGGTFFMPVSLFRNYTISSKGKAQYSISYAGSGSVYVTYTGLKPNERALCYGFYGNGVNSSTSLTARLYGRSIRCMKE